MSETLRNFGHLAKLFIITLCILMGLLFIVWLIPEKAVSDHVNEGIQLLDEREEAWEEHFSYAWGSNLDNVTDKIMIGRAVSNAEADSSLIFKMFYCNDYARYWHGYLVILRPLLSIMSYVQIRYLYMVIHMMALVGIALKMDKRFGRSMVYGWVLSMIAVNFISLPFSLQYSWVYFIMYGALYYIDSCYRKNALINSDKEIISFFLVIGMLTSFMDLLTAPLVTLGIPLIYILMLRICSEKESEWRHNIIMTIKASAIWAVGYIGCWLMKWILAVPILKRNLILEAVLRIGVQTKGNLDSELGGGGSVPSSLFKALAYNVYALLPPGLVNEIDLNTWLPFFVFVFICMAILAVLFIRYHEPKKEIVAYIPVALLMLYPYAWYGVTTRHAQIHPMFTYRDQIVTVMGGWIILSYSISWTKIKQKLGHRYVK